MNIYKNKIVNHPNIRIGDKIKIKASITEGNKERIQSSEGIVISIKNSNLNKTITIRKVIQAIGVEKIYPLQSPKVKAIEIIHRSKVRKAKLYYLRTKVGKANQLQKSFN